MRNTQPRLKDYIDGETVCLFVLAFTVLVSAVYCLVEDYEVKKQQREAAKLACPLCGRSEAP